ncbi:hypothetical protein KBA73_02625 [Patescibacteria group bacterium]|nr:hypothetical protein [Patescibacteria group bacterium]
MPVDSSPQSPIQFRLAEIDVNLAPSDEKITGLFRIDSEQRGKKGPVLVVLAEIASTLYVYEQLLDVIEQAAEQTRHLLSAVDTDSVVRFEKITQKLNEAVAQFVAQEPTPVSWNRVNLYVIEFSDHFLCLTGIGRMCSIFLQKQKDGQHRAFDLFGSLEQPAEINPQKPFASLICGDMHPGDLLFAGTLNFERLRQELEIKERLLSLPPVTACLEIRQDLEKRNIPDQFCALVVSAVPLHTTNAIPVIEAEEEPIIATDSVQLLHEEAMKTESILSPTATPLHQLPRPLAKGVEFLQSLQSRISHTLAERRATPSTKQRSFINHDPLTLTSLRGMSAGHGAMFNSERKKKLTVLAVLLVLIIGGGTWLYRAQRFAAEQELWNSILNQAVDRKNRAEGDLVYKNEDNARRLLKEASDLITPLSEDTADRKTAKEKFLAELTDVQSRLKHEVRIEQPTEIYASSNGALQTLALSGSQLVTVDGGKNTLVTIDPETKEARELALPSESSRIVTSAVTAKDTVVLLTEDHIALLANLTAQKVGIISFTLTNASSITAISPYNGRLYALDTNKGMIWRYSPNGTTSFAQERGYLKAADPLLQTGTAIAIDSNIYVGLQDGSIKRYLSGAETSWNPRGIDPPLTSISGLWASPESDRIVVLDHTNKRVIVLNKDGQLLTQYTSAAFDDLRGVTVDSSKKKIFVINSTRLFQLDLP